MFENASQNGIYEKTMKKRTWAPWRRRGSLVRSREALGVPPPDENVPKTTDKSCGKKRAAGKREGPMLQETFLCAAGWAKPIWIE